MKEESGMSKKENSGAELSPLERLKSYSVRGLSKELRKQWEEEQTNHEVVLIYRYINGISLNGREYLLDEENKELKFDNKEQALNFLSDGGVEAKDEEELEEYGIYFEIEEEVT